MHTVYVSLLIFNRSKTIPVSRCTGVDVAMTNSQLETYDRQALAVSTGRKHCKFWQCCENHLRILAHLSPISLKLQKLLCYFSSWFFSWKPFSAICYEWWPLLLFKSFFPGSHSQHSVMSDGPCYCLKVFFPGSHSQHSVMSDGPCYCLKGFFPGSHSQQCYEWWPLLLFKRFFSWKPFSAFCYEWWPLLLPQSFKSQACGWLFISACHHPSNYVIF